MKYFLGIDIGTTNVKLVIFNDNWEAIITEERGIKTIVPKKGYSEQDPKELVKTTTDLLKSILQKASQKNVSISGMGLSTAMHSFLAVDENMEPLTNVWIWSDLRASQISDSLRKNNTVKKYFEKSNVPLHPMLPLTKWLWFNQYSKNKKSAYKILSFKEYIIHHWFGELVTDVSMAGSMGYYHMDNNDWNYELLQYLKLDVSQLPEIKPVSYSLSIWRDEIKAELMQDQLVPLILGSSDGCLANMAAGVLDKTKASLTIGTSGAVRTAYEKSFNQEQRLFCYPLLENYYVVGGAINNGGNALEWYKENISNNAENFWSDFDDYVRTVQPGAEGLVFLPYLHGERAPLWDPSLRGAYLGLSNTHTNRHFLRATLEGIGFALKHIFKLIDARPNTIKTVIADGGFTESKVWVQLICDILGVEVHCPETSYGAAKGAAILSRMAIDNTLVEEIVFEKAVNMEVFKPKKANKELYEKLFVNYLNASSLINQWGN